MTFKEFSDSIADGTMPDCIGKPLQALWLDAKGDWTMAHEVAQSDQGRDAAWVHAYLHRKEPDLQNASYWYARSKQSVCRTSLEEEWKTIVEQLLAEHP